MLDLTPDYREKILHVGLRNPAIRVRKNDENGLVYNPVLVYAKINTISENMYQDFFKVGSEVILFPVRTEEGPRELVEKLIEDFGIEQGMYVGGIAAPFRATPEQARRIIADLRENPQRYFTSKEKKDFWL